MNTCGGREIFKNPRIVLSSGFSSSIVTRRLIMKPKNKKMLGLNVTHKQVIVPLI